VLQSTCPSCDARRYDSPSADLSATLRSKNISMRGLRNCRSIHCAPPDYL